MTIREAKNKLLEGDIDSRGRQCGTAVFQGVVSMPDEKAKKRWNPKDLYGTPEFPEERSSTVLYGGSENRSRTFAVSMAVAAALIVLLGVMFLTGLIRLPSPAGTQQSGVSATVQSMPAPPPGMPLVSEIMAANSEAFAAENGKYYDWIEIYNPTDHAINLRGFALSDNPDKPMKFVLPDCSLGSGEFAVVFASGKKPSGNEIAAPFKLKTSGALLFAGPDGKTIQQIDYPKLSRNSSFAMDMNDFSKWSQTDRYTPGFPNTDAGYAAFQASRPSAAPSSSSP